MLQRKTVAIDYCLNRAAECEKLAALAPDRAGRVSYRRLAAAWLRLARNAEFTDKLEAHLSGEKAGKAQNLPRGPAFGVHEAS